MSLQKSKVSQGATTIVQKHFVSALSVIDQKTKKAYAQANKNTKMTFVFSLMFLQKVKVR